MPAGRLPPYTSPVQAQDPCCLNRILLRWYKVSCEFIKSQELKDTFYYRRTPMVNVRLSLPHMDGQDYATARFNMYYRQKARASFNYARTRLYPQAVRQYQYAASQEFPFHTYELIQTFEPTYCKKPIVSLYYDQYEFTGGAHGNTVRSADTWDMSRGTLLRLSDLFKAGYDYRTVIIRTIENEALRRQETGQVPYLDDLEENIVKFFDEKNFYLSEIGVVIFYPLYTIAPYVAGIQTFTVPWILFGNNLRIKP